MKRKMNILFCTSKQFSIYLYVLCHSIVKNNRDYDITFYVVCSEELDIIEDLKSFVISDGAKLEYIYLDSSIYEEFHTRGRWTDVVYFKLLPHKYLPEDMDKILYVDMDTICDGSLAELYEINLENKHIAACANSASEEVIAELNALNKRDIRKGVIGSYLNSGVVLYNLDKFRNEIAEKDILEAYNECIETCEKMGLKFLLDQSVLSYMFCTSMVYVQPLDFNYRLSIKLTEKISEEQLEHAKKAIIHYTSYNQPYKAWDIHIEEEEEDKCKW